jgi:hypothetical protein
LFAIVHKRAAAPLDVKGQGSKHQRREGRRNL